MARFREAVQRATRACKNSLNFNNVYDCARPLLAVMGLFGLGGTRVCQEDGVYTLRNNRFSLLVCTCVSVFLTPYYLLKKLVNLFTGSDFADYRHYEPSVFEGVSRIIKFFTHFLICSTVAVACIMTHVYRKRLETIFQIINNIDSQLERANIRVRHWKITLKVVVLALITADYNNLSLILNLHFIIRIPGELFPAAISLSMHLFYMWTILVLLIIHERFVGLNKLLQENATGTNIQIIEGRNPRDSYMLRRIALARHVHEQLTEVVQLFSDTCRYAILGLILTPILDSLFLLLFSLSWKVFREETIYALFMDMIRIVALIGICQANKAERRVLNARLRHLVAFETDREIIHQVQQHIMFNAYSTPGLIDFQFVDIDNTLWLTIIDLIASNALIIYSYSRQWTTPYGLDIPYLIKSSQIEKALTVSNP